MERVTRNERQHWMLGGIQYIRSRRIDNFNNIYPVLIISFQRTQTESVSILDLSEVAEECVAVPGDGDISAFAWERRSRNMVWSNSERASIAALKNNRGNSDRRNCEFSDRLSGYDFLRFRPEIGRKSKRSIEFCSLVALHGI
jgi:hypothetical protein